MLQTNKSGINNRTNVSGFAFFPILVLFLLTAGLVIGVTAVKQRTSTNSKAYSAGDCAAHGGFSGYGDDCDCGINGGTKVRVVECNDGTTLPAEQLGGSCANECTGDQKTNPSKTPQPAGGVCSNNGGLSGYGDDCDCSNQPDGKLVRVAECNDGKVLPLEQIGSCAAGTCKDGQKVNPNATPLPASGSCSTHGGTSGFGTDCDCGRKVSGSSTSGEKVKVEVCKDDTKFTLEPTGVACDATDCSSGGIHQVGTSCQEEDATAWGGCLCISSQAPNCETAGFYYLCSGGKWAIRTSYDDATCTTDACQGLVQCTNTKPPAGATVDTQKVGLVIDHFGEVGPNVPGDINKDGTVNIVDIAATLNQRHTP